MTQRGDEENGRGGGKWNLLLGIVAVLVSLVMALFCAVALFENLFLLLNLSSSSLAENFGQYLFLAGSVVYLMLFIAQLIVTVMILRRRRASALHFPGLVVTVLNASATALIPFAFMVPLFGSG
jgi:glucose dehydrogenase